MAFLRLYPPPPSSPIGRSEIPTAWLNEAVAWLVGSGLKAFQGFSDGRSLTVGAQEAAAFLAQARASGALTCMLTAGRRGGRMRAISGCFGRRDPNMAFAAGGAAVSDAGLVRALRDLEKVAGRLAPSLAYAFASVDPHLDGFAQPVHPTAWAAEGGERPEDIEAICDSFVFDAFYFQILGPRHLEGFAGRPPGKGLDGGRLAVTIGAPIDWVAGLTDEVAMTQLRAEGRAALEPCLLKAGGARREVRARQKDP